MNNNNVIINITVYKKIWSITTLDIKKMVDSRKKNLVDLYKKV